MKVPQSDREEWNLTQDTEHTTLLLVSMVVSSGRKGTLVRYTPNSLSFRTRKEQAESFRLVLGWRSRMFQIGDTREMARIVGQYGQVMKDGGGTNENIKV